MGVAGKYASPDLPIVFHSVTRERVVTGKEMAVIPGLTDNDDHLGHVGMTEINEDDINEVFCNNQQVIGTSLEETKRNWQIKSFLSRLQAE